MKKTRKRRPKYDPSNPKSPALRERAMMMVKDRECGCTLRALAAHYGVSVSLAWSITKGVRVLFNRRPPAKQSYYKPRPERAIRFFELRQQAYQLRAQGFSYREIEERTGLSDSTAYKYCRRVLIRELQGRAWLSRKGRPKAWKKSFLKGDMHHG